MNEQLQRITSILAQSCATYPSGKRGVFEAMESLEGKTLKESSHLSYVPNLAYKCRLAYAPSRKLTSEAREQRLRSS